MRIVSLAGDVSLRPAQGAAVRVEGNLALGSGHTQCDDASRGQMRFVRGGTAPDQVFVCASNGIAAAAWIPVLRF
jgi:hypothetical protein